MEAAFKNAGKIKTFRQTKPEIICPQKISTPKKINGNSSVTEEMLPYRNLGLLKEMKSARNCM